MSSVDLENLKKLDYHHLTEDLEEAKEHLDIYGLALVKNVLSNEEVSEMDVRLTEQFHGEEKNKVGSKVRGDEGLGVESSEEDKGSRLVWNLVNKGDCFLKLIDHPKILPLIQHIIGERVCLCSMGAHMNGSGNERMALHQDQWPLVPHPMEFPFMANVMYLISDNSPESYLFFINLKCASDAFIAFSKTSILKNFIFQLKAFRPFIFTSVPRSSQKPIAMVMIITIKGRRIEARSMENLPS